MQTSSSQLARRVAFTGAFSANVLNMVGIGPFLTIPLALAAMGGPQAILGWILGALLSLCDGLVWAELGAAMPVSGGPYHYLLQAFGPRTSGRLVSFVVLWQCLLIGPVTAASGAVGFADYAKYLVPTLSHGQLVGLAVLVCLLNTALLYRTIASVQTLSTVVTLIVVLTSLWIVAAGFAHFHASMAFDFPAGAFQPSRKFLLGLGSGTLIALYDYAGYYNVCLIGGEVCDAGKTIPRSILWSIALVACIYLAMNISILGVLPWRQAMHSQAIVAEFMQHIYGPSAGRAVSVLILIAAFASVFAVLLGYSRIPYTAAVDGRFFSAFARLHSAGKFPSVSVPAMGILAAISCFFSLSQLITVLIIVQTMVQFVGQCIAVMVLRKRGGRGFKTYKMPLYPLPALIALAGWVFIVFTSEGKYIALGLLSIATGAGAYLIRAYNTLQWPFDASPGGS